MSVVSGSESLRPLFEPKSIAVIGASATPGKFGHTVLSNLANCEFPGQVYPVHPDAQSINGMTAYARIRDVPETIDCAILLLPSPKVVGAVRDCADAGVRSVVIGASGFAETGTAEGEAAQDELARIARTTGMRVLGPNTNGLTNASRRLSLGYNAEHSRLDAAGTISIVSHSGALFGGAVGTLRRLGAGLSKFVPVGNEADITMLEVLEYLVSDPDTSVIGLVMEGLSNGIELRRIALQAQRAGKPIVAMKVGRSTVGVQATLAHSSRLAGSARAYEALFEECGIATVRSIETLAAGCAVLAARSPAATQGDQRLVCISTSGAGGALLADFAEERHIPLAGDSAGEWEGRVAEVARAIPAGGRIRHPLDTGSLRGDWYRINDIFGALEEDGVGGPTVVYAHVAPTSDRNNALLEVLRGRKQRTGSPVVVVAPGGLTEELENAYKAAGIPLFHDLNTCFDSLACHYATLKKSRGETTDADWADTQSAPSVLPNQVADSSFLSELESASIMRTVGVPIVESKIVESDEDVRSAVKLFGSPLVMKALPPGVAHKSDQGFVLTDLRSEAAAIEAFHTLGASITAQGFSEKDTVRIIQPMLSSRMELIVGVSREQGLGHFLLVGLGGIHADVLDEVVLIPIPVSHARIVEIVNCSKLGRLFNRIHAGKTPVIDQVCTIMDALQTLIRRHAEAIDSIDLNPVLVTAAGCIAVDALVVPGRNQH